MIEQSASNIKNESDPDTSTKCVHCSQSIDNLVEQIVCTVGIESDIVLEFIMKLEGAFSLSLYILFQSQILSFSRFTSMTILQTLNKTHWKNPTYLREIQNKTTVNIKYKT